MQISRVDAVPVSYPEPNDSGAIRHLCFVRTTASDGTVGWGESITQWPEASLATREIVRGLAPLVVGSNPQHVEAIWRRMLDHVWWYGYRGGIASNAIAAIDMSLWDLAGKLSGRSVLDLLGGPVHDRLPAIVSCHAFRADIDELVEEMTGWVGDHRHGIKIGFGKRGDSRLGFEHDRDVEFVGKLRNALGPDKQIMVDLGITNRWDVATAVRRTRAFEEFGLAWIEEPLGAWDPDGYRDLRAKTSTLIGYGEREWEPAGYGRILQTGTVDVVG
ncbi:MAG TPA: mandelate racemase/muconate lactonizing enzyme family protein, partial [Mycobacteriales bacterium]|nr:mandelate racemase/muconate lactonizing enzyme family protein [Mycobacteriales bacterium]